MSQAPLSSDDRFAFRRIVRLKRRLNELGYQDDDIFGALDDLERLRTELAEMRASRDRLADLAMARGERR